MSEFLITLFWIIIFLLCIYRFRFFEMVGLESKYNYAAFIYKLLLGFANYYIWLNMIGHGDSLRYVHDSDLVYSTLRHHPADYFQLLIGHSKAHVPEHLKYITENLSIEWHVSEYNMVRLLAILNLFTFGSAWGNIAILSFLSFIASTALYKTLIRYFDFDTGRRKILMIIIFFIPSIVFWSSALLKEGPTLILLSVLFIQLISIENKFSWRRMCIISCTLFLLWLVRDYLLFLIVPNLVIFFLLRFYHKPEWKYYLGLTLLLIVSLCFINSRDQYFTGLLKDQQIYFLENPKDPDYHFHLLTGKLWDIIANLPYAINNLLFRPNLLRSSDPFRIYQAFELFATWIFVIIWFMRFKWVSSNLLTRLFFLFFSAELLFIYCLLVTDADTLSRYRTVPLFFLLILLVSGSRQRNSLKK